MMNTMFILFRNKEVYRAIFTCTLHPLLHKMKEEIYVNELIEELNRYQIRIEEKYPRVLLSGGDKHARKYYSEFIEASPELECELILELAKKDDDLMFEIEERAAIREADGLPGDLRSAVMCNFTRGY